jgi:ABC-type Zn2+ transport system substrate-binding protein/surface adhesin
MSERAANICRKLLFTMHNKLQVGEPLHDGNGLAHIPVSPGTSPSAQNVTQMRAALAANHPQWTGGWTVLNDPLRGL